MGGIAVENQKMAAALQCCSIFDGLSPVDLNQVAEQSRWRRYAKNEVVFESQELFDYYSVISEGLVQYSFDDNEKYKLLHGFGAAGSFGASMSLVLDKPMLTQCKALRDTVLILIPKVFFDQLLKTHISVTYALLQLQAKERFLVMTHFSFSLNSSSKKRVAVTLLGFIRLLGKCVEPDRDSPAKKIELIHEELASLSGVTRQSVALALKEWKAGGFVETGRKGLICCDPDVFAEYVDGIE